MPAYSSSRYGSVAQLFHWLTVILVGAAYLISTGGPEQRVYSAAVDATRQTHESLGILVLLVTVLRLVWRLADPPPEQPPMEPWMQYTSRLVHFALFALLLALPLTAITGAWLEGHPLTLLTGNIDPGLQQSHDLGRTITKLHTWLGNVIIWVAGLHAAAALVHHFLLRDGVLVSMLPVRRQRG